MKKRNNLFSVARLVCIFAIALFLCFTTGCTSEQFIGALGEAVGSVIDSLHDATAWLDFQRTPKEVQELYEKDRVGMTKAEVLAEIVLVEHSQRLQRLKEPDFINMYVMFPSNTSECVINKLEQWQFTHDRYTTRGRIWKFGKEEWGRRDLSRHTHDPEVIDNPKIENRWQRTWGDYQDGFEYHLMPKQWNLRTVSDFEKYLDTGSDDSISTLNVNSQFEIVRLALQKSCCWSIFYSRRVGSTYQIWTSWVFDCLIIEFDSLNKVKRQRHITWSRSDG